VLDGHHPAGADRARRRDAARARAEVLDPGGSSTPLLTAEHLDVPLDFEGWPAAGSILGTTATQIFSDQDCPVYATLQVAGVLRARVVRQVHPVPRGQLLDGAHVPPDPVRQGTHEDLDTLLDTCDNILGRAFCGLGDGATSPVTSSLQYFKQDYLDYIEGRTAPKLSAKQLVGAH
jgi:NADH-quinone oxidoreductase subunit F